MILPPWLLLPVLVSDCFLTHTRLLYVVYISYTSMAYHWRIHHLILYTALVNSNTPSSICNTSKIISYMSSYAENKKQYQK